MVSGATKTIAVSLCDLADRLGLLNKESQELVRATAARLESLEQHLTRAQKETAWLRMQRHKAIRTLIAIDSGDDWSCPLDMAHLDEQFVYASDRLGLGCVHRDFDGQCPLEADGDGGTEDQVYECWLAWLEGRQIG